MAIACICEIVLWLLQKWLLILSTIVFAIVYQCVLRDWSYFSKQNIKFIRGIPFLGAHYRALLGWESTPDSFQKFYEQFPNEKISGFYDIGGRPSYVVRDPELIKHMAIRDFDHFTNHIFEVHEKSDSLYGRSLIIMRDQRWRDMRSTLSPAFTGSKMKLMFSLLDNVSKTFCEYMRKDLNESNRIECDVRNYYTKYATDAIASCAFGLNTNTLKDGNNTFYGTACAMGNFSTLDTLIFFAYGTIPKIMNFFRIRIFRDVETNYFRKIVKDTMANREAKKIVRNDMIHLLMEAKRGTLGGSEKPEKDMDMGFATVEEFSDKNEQKIQKWHDDDLVAQCLAFFLGGFAPVALTLCFASHELALNQDIQEQLYAEIVAVQTQLAGKSLSYEQLQGMKYMDMVVSETLRRWTQSAANNRYVNKPYVLENVDGHKIQLNVGDAVWFPVQGLHMDAKYFPNPEKFDPDRFSDENKHNIGSSIYIPFGLGPRNCIASRFALMECKSLLYHLVLNFHLSKCVKTQDPLQLKRNSGNVDAENGFWIEVNLRDQ